MVLFLFTLFSLLREYSEKYSKEKITSGLLKGDHSASQAKGETFEQKMQRDQNLKKTRHEHSQDYEEEKQFLQNL
jgi:hypothetical protein